MMQPKATAQNIERKEPAACCVPTDERRIMRRTHARTAWVEKVGRLPVEQAEDALRPVASEKGGRRRSELLLLGRRRRAMRR